LDLFPAGEVGTSVVKVAIAPYLKSMYAIWNFESASRSAQ
jgi:hypothetical protein